MKYQLSTGKTVFITFEQWLNMDDEMEREMIANDMGRFIEDPFSGGEYKKAKVVTEDISIPEIELDPEEVKRIIEEIDQSEDFDEEA